MYLKTIEALFQYIIKLNTKIVSNIIYFTCVIPKFQSLALMSSNKLSTKCLQKKTCIYKNVVSLVYNTMYNFFWAYCILKSCSFSWIILTQLFSDGCKMPDLQHHLVAMNQSTLCYIGAYSQPKWNMVY